MNDEESARGVLIGDTRSSIRIVRIGKGDEAGFPARIEVKAGPFSGVVSDDTIGGMTEFRRELARMYDTLHGEAKLSSYEKLSLAVIGDHGDVTVRVELYGEHVPRSKLEFEFLIDQSYLPAIIRQIGNEFPEFASGQ